MENNAARPGAPWHFWVVGVILLLWGAMGSFDYAATVARFEPYLSKFPEEALAYYYDAPWWMYVLWGVSSIGSLLTAIFYLARNKMAVPLFALSWLAGLGAVIRTMINPPPNAGGGETMFMLIIMAVTLLLLVYLIWLKKRGILR